MSDEHYDGEPIECWQCYGQGVLAGCFEDTCVCLGHPEDPNDCCAPTRCDVCHGKGGWIHREPAPTPKGREMADLSNATPRPWRVGDFHGEVESTEVRHLAVCDDAFTLGDQPIAAQVCIANAALIVQAVNEREELLAVLRDLLNAIKDDHGERHYRGLFIATEKARAALAKAKG